MDFDLQRFVSNREGPNVPQAYDALYLGYKRGAWTILGAYTPPGPNAGSAIFRRLRRIRHHTFSGLVIRRRLWQTSQLSVSYSRYTRDAATFTNVSGKERRANIDVQLTGNKNGFDWDIEAMNQTGRIGAHAIKAWAFGSSNRTAHSPKPG